MMALVHLIVRYRWTASWIAAILYLVLIIRSLGFG